MEGLSNFRIGRGPPFWIPGSSEGSEDISVSEIRSRHSRISKPVQTSSVPSANIGAWLDNACSSTPGDDSDYARVALVWVNMRKDHPPWRLDIRQSSFELVMEKFMIENAYRYCYSGSAGMAAFPTSNCENKETRSYCLFMSDVFALAWSHNPTRGTSQGVCLAEPWAISTFQALFKNQISMATHPMFLAAVAGLTLEHILDRDLAELSYSIGMVEIRTGYHGWATPSTGAAEGDYATLSAKMSGSGTSLAGLKRIAKVLRETIEFISQCSPQKGSGVTSTNSQHNDAEFAMQECLTVLKSRLTMEEIEVDFLLHRTQIQITALFNLIAQKDANLNITLAKDSRTLASASKRDSSSMKTLAAVTVAFLPGTFISSLFAMPLLDWNAGRSDSVVNAKFWIYWAFTIPLTLLTMFIWLIWTHRQTLLHRAQDRKAREQLDDDIREDQDGKIGQEV